MAELAEIIDDDKDAEEVSFWPEDRLKNVEKATEESKENIGLLHQHIKPGEITGIKEILEGKNEFDPGHSHLFPPKDVTVIFTHFESLDSWTIAGTGTEVISNYVGGTVLQTGTSANDSAHIRAIATGNTSAFDVSQTSIFQSVLSVNSATSITGYWGVGDITNGGAFGASLEEGYGFKYVSGTLSALTVESGVEVLTTIAGITATNFNEYRATFNGKNRVNFFVNGRLRASHTTRIPNTDDDVFGTFYVETETTAARSMNAKYFYFLQQNI